MIMRKNNRDALSWRTRLLTSVGLMFLFTDNVQASIQLQPDSYLAYVPSLPGNTVVAIIYSLLFFALMYHTLFTGKKVDKWALVLPIGTFFAALGYWLRLPMRQSQDNEPLYTVMYLFVVLSPAAFLAFNYIAFGRFTAALEGNKPTEVKKRSDYLFIPPRLVKIIFVTSDVCTFCVQAAGGGMQTSNDIQTANAGNTVFLAGVSAQGGSYLLFTALVLVAHYRLLRKRKDGRRFVPWNFKEPKAIMLDLLYISSVGIIVRSVYRIIEMRQGYNGYLYSHEIFTFTLDALPLFFAIGAWAFYWPGLLIAKIREEASENGNYRINSNNGDVEKDADTTSHSPSTSANSPEHQTDTQHATTE